LILDKGKEMLAPAGGMTPTLAATRDALFRRTAGHRV